jgi:hypothetical protein
MVAIYENITKINKLMLKMNFMIKKYEVRMQILLEELHCNDQYPSDKSILASISHQCPTGVLSPILLIRHRGDGFSILVFGIYWDKNKLVL